MSFASAVEAATKTAVCGWLANGGNAAVATWIVNGSRTPMTAVAGAAAGLGLLALNYGCNYDAGNTTGQSDFANSSCTGWDAYLLRSPLHPSYGNWYAVFWTHTWDWVGWTPTGKPEFRNKSTGQLFQASDYTRSAGAEVGYGKGSTKTACTGGPTGAAEPYEPHTYVDADTNCTYVVEHEAFVMNDDGQVTPILKISPGAQAMASGGVIGGCNFNPVLVVPPGGGGGGGGVVPWTPQPDGPDGKPWWWEFAMGLAGRLAGAGIEALLKKLFEEKAPGVTYRLVSVCETDAQGEAISQSREVTIPQLPILDALVARVDAMDDLMQGLKDFKQPICDGGAPASGINYSVQFRSAVVSPNGDKPLRKELRYRDQGDAGLKAHRDHWIGFEWTSGPWQVISTGLPWGRPQVWASSPEEGKRVLAHAAQISGVNLQDPKHKWVVKEVQNGRYGPQLKMLIRRDARGVPWITTRTGSSGFPEALPQLSPDPRVAS